MYIWKNKCISRTIPFAFQYEIFYVYYTSYSIHRTFFQSINKTGATHSQCLACYPSTVALGHVTHQNTNQRKAPAEVTVSGDVLTSRQGTPGARQPEMEPFPTERTCKARVAVSKRWLGEGQKRHLSIHTMELGCAGLCLGGFPRHQASSGQLELLTCRRRPLVGASRTTRRPNRWHTRIIGQ